MFFQKILLGGAAALAAAGLAAAGAASASAAPLYADTSVSVAGHPVVDEITGITAPGTAALPAADTLTFSATGFHPGLAWTYAIPAVTHGLTFAVSGDQLTVSGTPLQAVQVVAKATDAAGSTGLATVTVTPGTPVAVAVTDDVVSLPVAETDNMSGSVGVPAAAGVTETLSNAPSGVAVSGDSIVATSAVPGPYGKLAVTGTDAGGAAAVETLSVLVKGSVVRPDVPVLSRGHAVSTAATREEVFFTLTGPATWVHFTIVGPGAINGHEGWVYATPGVNSGFYEGLLGGVAGHGYTVFYVPVTAEGGTVPVAGSHGGYVFFRTNPA